MNKRSDLQRLEHILEHILKIENSLPSSQTDFLGNEDKKAVLFAYMAVIGEAASRLTKELRQCYPEVHWQSAISLRNILVHDYSRVDYSILWDTAKEDLPVLKKQIQKILEEIS